MFHSLQLHPNDLLHAKVVQAWNQTHRHYHSIAHLNACLVWLDRSRAYGLRIAEIEFALWFHDVIYKTRSNTNEIDSALWARESLQAAGAQQTTIERIESLILATQHGAKIAPNKLHDADQNLMLDIDLAILGTDQVQYDQFEKNIRREYWWVLPWVYRKARAKILQGFLDAPSIYRSDYFRSMRELQARCNLQSTIRRLIK